LAAIRRFAVVQPAVGSRRAAYPRLVRSRVDRIDRSAVGQRAFSPGTGVSKDSSPAYASRRAIAPRHVRDSVRTVPGTALPRHAEPRFVLSTCAHAPSKDAHPTSHTLNNGTPPPLVQRTPDHDFTVLIDHFATVWEILRSDS
jgi:hypothetical protein